MKIPKGMTVMTNGAGQQAVTHADAARLLGISKQGIVAAVAANDLPSERIHDRLKLIPLAAVAKYRVSERNQANGRGVPKPKRKRKRAGAAA